MEWLLEVRDGVFPGRALSFRSYRYMYMAMIQLVPPHSDEKYNQYSVEIPKAWEPIQCTPS